MSCISGKALSRHHFNPPYSPLLLSLLGTSFGRDARLIRARFERVREGGSFTNASVGGTGGRVKEAAGGAGLEHSSSVGVDPQAAHHHSLYVSGTRGGKKNRQFTIHMHLLLSSNLFY